MGGGRGASQGPLRRVNWKLAIRPAALADIHETAEWYEEQRPGLGVDFARAIRQAISALPKNPLIYRLRNRRRRARWFLPPRFPYRIIYRAESGLVTVIAVIHAARHDREWKKRL